MSLALKWDDEDGAGFIFMDAVTAYTQDHSGKVTQHPIDSGGVITDHFVKNNSRYRISAVISGLDISTGSYLIQDAEGSSPYNTNFAPNLVQIISTDSSVLRKFIPDTIGQFLPEFTPEVIVDAQRTDLLEQIKEALITLVSGEVVDEETGRFTPKVQLLDLYEYDGSTLTNVINRLVMTSVTFRETPDTGYALYCDFSFERVTFADFKQAKVPTDVQDSIKKKASTKSTKGKQDSKVQDPSTGDNPPKDEDLSALRQARGN